MRSFVSNTFFSVSNTKYFSSTPTVSAYSISRKPEELVKRDLDEEKASSNLLPDMVFLSGYFLDIFEDSRLLTRSGLFFHKGNTNFL